jgi:hypothetical protein
MDWSLANHDDHAAASCSTRASSAARNGRAATAGPTAGEAAVAAVACGYRIGSATTSTATSVAKRGAATRVAIYNNTGATHSRIKHCSARLTTSAA